MNIGHGVTGCGVLLLTALAQAQTPNVPLLRRPDPSTMPQQER